MKHRVGFNALSRRSGHRKALLKNMSMSLLRYERVTTTKAKALEVRRSVEKMITRAKVDSVHNRREIAKSIPDRAVVAKLFTDIAPRFEKRPGGYTRILKLGYRKNDAAEMVLLELVERDVTEKKGSSKKKTEASDKQTDTAASKDVVEVRSEQEPVAEK